ncbi:MAG: glycosyltransferase family 2 protein [Gracilibacteraceae bacterium]|jgi:hypothetical protein|nr:glycosyltransferase family 2 protein [Gracilibacteraceae bacterium]
MKLTACLITKNEERCLARCLDSLREAVDAIVVADTGSEDRTREIARARGARVIEIPWRDDFAWAKNRALDEADGDWILFPDADEYFAPGGAAALRAMLENGASALAGTDGVALRRYEGTDFSASSYTAVLRVFRLDPALRYKGAIHEDLRRAGAPPRIIDAPPAVIYLWHDGHDPSRAGAKIARNMRVMEKQIRAGDNDPLLFFHMSKTLDRQKERERIWEYSREFLLRDGSSSSVCLKAMLLADMALDFTPDAALAPERRAWLKEEALRRFPAQPAAYILAADECLERGDWGGALPLYAKAAELWQNGFDDFGDSDFRQEKSRPLVYARLGRCRQMTGDLAGARADFAAALDLQPDNPAAAAGYIECGRAEDARTVFESLSAWLTRGRAPLSFLAAARDKRCDMLYLYLYDHGSAGRLPLQYFATMQILVGAWYAAATDCCALIRRHPLWGGDTAAFFPALTETERTEISETLAEAAAGCLLAAGGWQPPGRVQTDEKPPAPARFLQALAAVAPPALSDAVGLCLGEDVDPGRREGLETARRTGERLAALGAPESVRLVWREALACLG